MKLSHRLLLIAGCFAIGWVFAWATSAHAQDSIRVCSGGEKGNYFASVQFMQDQADGSIDIQNVSTKGSWDNLQRLSAGECDAAIVQADAWVTWNKENGALNLDRIDTLYSEYVHMFCNKALDFDSVTDLAGRKDLTVAIGENGSGTAVTWRAMGFEDDSYSNTKGPKTVPYGGIVALTKVKDGSDVDCALFVSGLKSASMMEVDKQADSIALVPFNDYDFNDAKDPKGKALYEFVDIPCGTYPNMAPCGLFGDVDVETIALKATLVVRTDWVESHQDGYGKFVEAQLNAQPFIRQKVQPK